MYKYIKRFLDCILALCLLIGAWPFMIIAAILIRIDLGSPIIFKQQRIGKNNEVFTIYKFRTMRDDVDKNGNNLPDSERLTKLGKLFRKMSVDELPQLFNILKGDMSFIGPRPLVPQYLPYYNEEEIRRHDVTPGISGLAQINGRNGLNWEERFKLDVEYVDNMSFKLDLKIFFKTIEKVLGAKDVGVRGTGVVMDFDKFRIDQKNTTDIEL
ncbi:MAG: sugar transferase [Clostridiales bacterium]|nr:sugar transferase [Clostridiales bacterium]